MKDLNPFEVATLSRSLSRCPDPVALYATLSEGRPDTLLLESADLTTQSGDKSLVMSRAALRFTARLVADSREVEVVALSPNGRSLLAPLAERVPGARVLDQDDDRLRLGFDPPPQADEATRLRAPNVLDAVRSAVSSLKLVGGEGALPPLCAGSIAYDLLGLYETLPPAKRDPIGWPDFELWLAEEIVWVQHRARRSVAMRFVFGGPQAEAAYHDASQAMGALVSAIESVPRQKDGAPVAIPPDDGVTEVDQDDAAYREAVQTLKAHITAGDVFQIVPSRTFSRPCPEPLKAYAKLRALNPSPYMFFLHGAAGHLFGASPESALTVNEEQGRKVVRISPIAGTRPRARHEDGSIDRDLDARIEAELRLDEKEVAEHMMLVDLARNDVARVSKAGTRHVEQLLTVVRYSHVMHLVSLVAGELRESLDALHAYVATMNMGTLVGAPKLRAASLLREHEAARRGPYGGAVGYFSADGTMDSCIVIRSAVVKDGVAHVRAGGGVVHDSEPQAEADETRRKAGAVLAALRAAFGAGEDGA